MADESPVTDNTLWVMSGGEDTWGRTGDAESDLTQAIVGIYSKNATKRGLSKAQIKEVVDDAFMSSSFEGFASEERLADLKNDLKRIKEESKTTDEYEQKLIGLFEQYQMDAQEHIDMEAFNALCDSESINLDSDVPITDENDMENKIVGLRDTIRKGKIKPTQTYKQKIIGVMAEKGILASLHSKPQGWHNEPINHALASKGIKVGKSRTKR